MREGAAFYLEDTKRGEQRETEREKESWQWDRGKTEGLWEMELNEYFSSISLLLSSRLQFSETESKTHTNVQDTQILCRKILHK